MRKSDLDDRGDLRATDEWGDDVEDEGYRKLKAPCVPTFRRAIYEAADALHAANTLCQKLLPLMTPDDCARVNLDFNRDTADDLRRLILAFVDAYGSVTGMFIGVVDYKKLVDLDEGIRDLERIVEEKTEENRRSTRQWQAALEQAEKKGAEERARAAELAERVQQLERTLVYASAQVGARR